MLFTILGNSQGYESLEVHYTDTDQRETILTKRPKQKLYSLFLDLLEKGYQHASIDSCLVNQKNSSLKAFIHLGKQNNQLNTLIFQEGEKQDTIAAHNLPVLSFYIYDRLKVLENNGYPFAQIETSTSNYQVIKLRLDKGPFITLDSLIELNSPVNSAYIQNYLSIREGEPYSEIKLLSLRRKINNSKFLIMKSYPSVIFVKDGAKVYLNLEGKKANTFDGIIGIQPSENQRTTITGLVNLSLVNSLKRGEEIALNWERLLSESQRLKVSIAAPYLFKTKLGLAFQANIIRQDSTLNRSLIDYRLFYDFSSESRLSLGLHTARNNTNISEQSSFQNTSSLAYDIRYSYRQLDNVLNPRKGGGIFASGLIGERETLTAENIPLVNFSGQLSYFLPALKKTTILFQVKGETLNSDNLFSNELFQVGGLNFIRGIDQRSLNVSSWLSSTIEYRFLFDESSNIFIFGESHWNEALTRESYSADQISALGIGLSVGTKSGVFSFNYALSNQAENTFLFRNAKINFGFSSSF